jgi:hypothetical protein
MRLIWPLLLIEAAGSLVLCRSIVVALAVVARHRDVTRLPSIGAWRTSIPPVSVASWMRGQRPESPSSRSSEHPALVSEGGLPPRSPSKPPSR